ncbi:MAG: PAS domain S-box protein [Candidatus Geothermincolia bacterium]
MALHTNPKILVIDDDPDFASLLRAVLKSRFSAEVTTAGDCASARDAFTGSAFDVITVDYELPDGNGIDLMEEIVSRDGHPPVVMVTGKGDEQTAALACRVGAGGYVVKDQKLNTMLVAAIMNSLEHTHSAKLQIDSEIRYRRLFESARDGILILEAETGKIVDANPYLMELLGYSLEEFIGKQLWEIGPFKDTKLSKTSFAELKEKRYVRYENLPLETKDGRKADVEFVSNIYLCDHQEVIQCNIRDITARKRRETVLEESEAWYRALYESSIDGFVVAGLEGHIVEANPAFLDMLGYTLDEARALTYEQLTPKKWHQVELDILRDQVLERGYSDDYEKEDIRKDGSLIYISVRRWLIRDEQGKPSGMWAIVRDITERKRYEEQLQTVSAELEAYAHTVSHDLRGPLAVITGAVGTLETLLDLPLDEATMTSVKEVTGLMKRNAERSEHLVGDLLVLAEAGLKPEHVADVDVGDVVDSILSEMTEIISNRSVDVRVVDRLNFESESHADIPALQELDK